MPIIRKAGELTDCICEPSLHAEGCPRFQHEGELLPPETSSVTDVETEAPSQPENASETTESGSTENSVPEEIPAESEEEMASSDELENPESAVPEQEQAASSQEPVPDSSLSEEKETAQHEESEKKRIQMIGMPQKAGNIHPTGSVTESEKCEAICGLQKKLLPWRFCWISILMKSAEC